MTTGKLFGDVGLPPMATQSDRFMLCGSPNMLRDIKAILEDRGFVEGNHGAAGHYVIEKAFVES
jgi:ferredoxin--NADP+ reductase